MKRIYRLAALALMLVFISGCGGNVGLSAREIDAINEEETYPNGPYSLAAVFRSIDELYESADIVVVGEVISQSCADLDGFPRTTSQVEVETVLSGEYAAGEMVGVTEEGGTTRTGQFVYMAVPPMKQGERYLLFLTKESETGQRYVVGAFQGKFVIREGYLFQQATEEIKLTEDAYAPVPLEQFPKHKAGT